MARCVVCGEYEGHCSLCHRAHDQHARVRFNHNERRARREALGLSAMDIAMAIGVDDSTIYAWERGAFTPSVERLDQWDRVLEDA